jgi:hypothetical protein
MIESQAGASPARPLGRRAAWSARSRFAVHLGLLATLAASIATLQFLHVRVAIHTDVGLAFVGLVVVHLAQRRHTLTRLASSMVRARLSAERRTRPALSDLVLLIVTANVLISGVVDWGRGAPTQLPLPAPFYRWHLDAGLILVIYVAVHTWHRRRRLRKSTIR